MLEQLIEYYDNGNKSQYARRLGITPQGISTWIARNTFDSELIFAKCERINAEWLLTGEGPMLRSDEPPPSAMPTSESSPDSSLIYTLYKEKESEIKELNAKMLKMSEEIGRLKAKLGEDEPEDHSKGLGKKIVKDVSTKDRSSQSSPDVPSANVP